jgi:predicted porin
MKKSLLALAVLGAFAGAASAQTNVTIYGVADVGISRNDSGAATNDTTWSMDSGIQSGSRLGFKGTEDLGGGLSAIFTLENGFGIDNGALGQQGASFSNPAANRLFGRQAFVGLSGGFGTVKFGRQFTPIFQALDSIDPFGTGLAGDISRVFSAYGVRMDNTINYSMSAAGFSGQLAYGVGEVAGNTSGSRQIGLGLGYGNGPINVQFAYHDANNAADTSDMTTVLLGGTYDFRVVKAHLGLAQNETDAAGVTTAKSRDLMLGVSAPVGAGTVLASFVRKDNRLVGNADADQWAIGYTHGLSKRTNLYTSYSRTKNDAGSALNSAGAGLDSNVFNVGIRHKF